MSVTYTKLQIDTAGQTELLEQTGDQTMVAKQGKTSFAIHGQDGKASEGVDQKWHMISAEQVGENGSVIWQNADTGAFRETKYSIDKNQKTWTQSGEAQQLSTSEIYAREGEHKADLNGDGFESSSALSLKSPANQQQGSSEIMLESDGLINSTNKIVGQWKANRNTEYSIEGKDKALFKIDSNGQAEFKGDNADGQKVYEFEVKATDKSTNQSVTQTVKLQQRHVITVNNNAGDKREGSLGWAVERANQLGVKNIASEIRFNESMTIQSKNGYKLTHGDIKINTYDSKNISIKRTSNGSAFTIGEYKYANKHDVNKQPDLNVDASNINVFNTTAKGQDAAKNGGGGGGYGAGAGILHYNGHLTWSNSVFQGNKVEGGNGADIASKGRDGYYVKQWGVEPYLWKYVDPERGGPGRRGGGINDRNHSFGNRRIFGTFAFGNTSKDGVSPGFWEAGVWRRGGLIMGAGEGGIGPEAGAGAGRLEGYRWSPGDGRLKGGKPGQGSKAGYGGGQAAQGSGKIDDANTREWGGTSESNKGGRGAAQGAFMSSLAAKNDKNSVTIRSTDALGNEAQSSSSAGKTKNIHSRYIDVKIDNYRQSDNHTTPDQQRQTVEAGAYNTVHDVKWQYTDHTATFSPVDRSNAFTNSGTFSQAPEKEPTSITVRSNSFVVKENEANIVGQTIELDPNKSHVIFSGMQNNSANTVTPEIQNWEKWRDGISGIMQKVYSVKTEEAIRNSKKGFLETWGTALISGLGAAGAKTGPAGAIFALWKARASDLAESKRIEKELKEREQTITEHRQIEASFKEGLTINAIQITNKITRTKYNKFTLGTHTMEFQPGLDPLLKWETVTNGRAIISINNRDFANRTADNKAKQFALLELTREQTSKMTNIINQDAYINSFIQFKRQTVNGSRLISVRIGTQSKWLVFKNEAQKPLTGNSNDRVAIERDYGSGLTIKTDFKVNTFEGDDVIHGDRGRSTINAGRGNDYIQPGLGKDIVKGGEGIDTVSYANIDKALKASVENEKVTVKFVNPNVENEKVTMDDEITGVEKFVFEKKANIDFTGLAPAVEYSTTDPTRTTNSQVTRTIMFKEGSTFTGSNGDEKIIVDFDANKGTSNTVDSIQKVVIDGRGGRNTVEINGLDSYRAKGYKVSNDRTKGEISLVKGSSKKVIVGYVNIMGDPTVIDKENKIIKPELNPSKAEAEVKKVDPIVSPQNQSDADMMTPSTSGDNSTMVDPITGGAGANTDVGNVSSFPKHHDDGIINGHLSVNASTSGFETNNHLNSPIVLTPADAPFAESATITGLASGTSTPMDSGMDPFVAAGPLNTLQMDKPLINNF